MRADILVPLCEMGIGTGRVAVRDARTREVVWFPREVVTLAENVACAVLTSVGREDGLHRVLLPGGASCWVKEFGEKGRGKRRKAA